MASKNDKRAKVDINLREDRISRLPDNVLHSVLSFLSTKEAFVTSVLSTRWRCLFNSIPILDFTKCLPHSDTKGTPLQALRFMNFVERVLLLRKVSNIQEFCIGWNEFFDQSRLNAWICSVVSHDFKCLILSDDSNTKSVGAIDRVLPCSIFSCVSLTKLIYKGKNRILKLPSFVSLPNLKVLHLLDIIFKNVVSVELFFSNCPALEELVLKHSGCSSIHVLPSFISLPNLKVLHLSRIIFQDGVSIEQLFSNCPALEELVLKHFDWSNREKLRVIAPCLKSLKITDHASEENYKVIILAPSLVYFKYRGKLATVHFGSFLSSLLYAKINVWSIGTSEKKASAATELLQRISNVKSLKLDCRILGIISYVEEITLNLLTFNNLRCLEMSSNVYDICSLFLRDFINVSPNLESLIFAEGIGESTYVLDDDLVPECLKLHLKMVEVRRFLATPKETHLVQWFLKNARVLERMTIISYGSLSTDSQARNDVMEQLLMLPRGSANCVVKFS